MKPITLYQIDAFTTRPFGGNPAAICLMEDAASDEWLQALAAENNLSETAYVWRLEENRYRLRWFTPATEVDLCGHATLASAAALEHAGKWKRETGDVIFETQSGELRVAGVGPGEPHATGSRSAKYRMDFPATPANREITADIRDAVLKALGLEGCKAAMMNRSDLLIEVGSKETILALKPDFRALGEIDVRGVMVTAPGNNDGEADYCYDFVSRFFAPAEDIDEDPVTGSAHCTLGPWWGAKLAKTTMEAHQCSERGGELLVELGGGAQEADRVYLTGSAVIIFEGLLTPAVSPAAV